MVKAASQVTVQTEVGVTASVAKVCVCSVGS